MNNRKNPAWGFLDSFLLFSSGLIFLVSAYLLISDYSPFSKTKLSINRKFVAKITEKENKVRRKMADLTYWEDIFNQVQLFDQDLVFTHPGSNATVEFKNKTILKIPENTMIRIEEFENESSVEVLEGQMLADLAGGSIWFKTKEGVFKAQGENAQLEIRGDSLSVLKGDVEINRDGQNLKLNEGKELELKGNNIQDMLIAFQGPVGNRPRYVGPRDLPEVSWSSPREAQSFRVTVSKDEAFKNIVLQTTTESESLDLQISEGDYYVLVEALDPSGKILSRSLRTPVRWEKTSAPKLIYPKANENFVVKEKNKQFEFSWEQTGPDQYEVELIEGNPNDEGGQEIFIVSGNKENLEIKGTGEYSWRVRPIGPGINKEIWSEWRSFSVSSLQEKDRPFDLAPKNGNKIAWEDALEGIEFEWDSENGKKFIFDISSREAKSSESHKVKGQEITWKPRIWGLHRWRVSLDSNNPDSEDISSETHSLYISPPQLDDLSPSDGEEVEQGSDVKFAWESLKNYGIKSQDIDGYIIQVAQDENFSALVMETNVQGESVTWQAQVSGNYFWRVAGISQGVQTAWSRPYEIEVETGNERDLSTGSSVEEIAGPYQWDFEIRYLTLQQRINDTQASIYAKLKEDSPVGIGVKITGAASGLSRPWTFQMEGSYSMIKNIPEGQFGPYIRGQASMTKTRLWGIFGPTFTAGYENFKHTGYDPKVNNLVKKNLTAFWFPGAGLDFNFDLWGPSFIRLEGAVAPLAKESTGGESLFGTMVRGTYEMDLWESTRLSVWAQSANYKSSKVTINQNQTGATLGLRF